MSTVAYTAPSKTDRVTSIGLTPEMKEQVGALVLKTHGPRGMTRWIEDSLEALLADREFLGRVAAMQSGGAFAMRKSLRINARSDELLVEAVRRVRRIDPVSEVSRMDILRAAFHLAVERARPTQDTAEPAVAPEGTKARFMRKGRRADVR